MEVDGLLELTALPTIDAERWCRLVQETDVLLAAGGDAQYPVTGCERPVWPTCCRP
ncbi:MAG: hypothetical protein R2705_04475 [Ilumatobacteraceae bacterium]